MEWTAENILLVNFILITGSILQIATGVSVGMIIVPFLAIISYTLIPVPIIFASLILTIMMAYKGRQYIDIKNLPQIGFGMFLGILLSIYFIKNIEFHYLGLIFGLFILASVFISIKIKSFTLSYKINYAGGFIAGFMGATAGVGGQILALIFQNHKLESIKSTLAFLYTIFSIVMLVIFYSFDKFSYDNLISGIYMIPGFLIGFLISPYFVKYFNQKYAKITVLFMATFGAILLILKTIFL